LLQTTCMIKLAALAVLLSGCFTAAGIIAGSRGELGTNTADGVVTGALVGAGLDLLTVFASSQLDDDPAESCLTYGPREREARCGY
jgi:hypothetical protein